MVKIKESEIFKRIKSKLDKSKSIRIEKLVRKRTKNLEIGKPMRYNRKGMRELYSGSFRLSYYFDVSLRAVYLLDFYHKDKQ